MKQMTAAVVVAITLGLTLSACGSTADDTAPAPTHTPIDRSRGAAAG